MNVENIRENDCVRAVLQDSIVVLVCQHIFNRQRNNNKKMIYVSVYRNMTNDGGSQTSLSPIFCWGRGVLYTGYYILVVISE